MSTSIPSDNAPAVPLHAGTDIEVVALWNGFVLARSDHTIVIEGNHHFPPEDVDFSRLVPSQERTTCWKGLADYFDVVAGGRRNAAAAWRYLQPSPEAEQIKAHVAFWNGVKVDSRTSRT